MEATNASPKPSQVGAILEKHRDHFALINGELEKVFSSRIPLIQEMGSHVLLGLGKRLRPLLFVLSCRLCGCRGVDPHPLSTVFEFIHTASLLHDDVLDNAETRRRKPSANHVWGNQAAILEGDFLYSKSFGIALEANNLRFLRTLTDATTRMAEGQILEVLHTNDWGIRKDTYMEIITAKTAVLISAACAGGAIVSGRGADMEARLGAFGLNLGVAFQLMDDLLDYCGSEEVIGKPVGKDLKEGKVTLPLIHTLPALDPQERRELELRFRSGRATQADHDRLRERVQAAGVVEVVKEEAETYASAAASSLSGIPPSPELDDLLELNQLVVEREY